MSASTKLRKLAESAFKFAGESVPLGFDVTLISATTFRLPHGLPEELRSLLENDWPSDFFVGAIEFIGPQRIKTEHEELYPGLGILPFGFICIGSDGAGAMFSYDTADSRVYLLSHECFSDDGLHPFGSSDIEMNAENIKSVAIETWDTLEALFDWAIIRLNEIIHNKEQDA